MINQNLSKIYLTQRINVDETRYKEYLKSEKVNKYNILGYNPFNCDINLEPFNQEAKEQNKKWSLDNKTSVLAVRGLLEKNQSFDGWLSGYTSTSLLAIELQKAIDSDSKKIYIIFDSVGGEVGGIERLSNLIKAGREKKDIIAVVEGVAFSGAYWLASACTNIICTEKSSEVGSIGVKIKHVDRSEQLKAEGIKITEITAGKDKTVGSQDKPLSDEDFRQLEDKAKKIHEIFKTEIKNNRDIKDIEQVATGKVFLAEEALSLGLIDSIRDINVIFKAEQKGEDMEFKDLTEDKVKENAKGVYDAIFAAGQEAEQKREKNLDDVAIKGFEHIIYEAKKDLKATVASVAIRLCEEMKNKPLSIQAKVEKKVISEDEMKQKMLATLKAENQKVELGAIPVQTTEEQINSAAITAVQAGFKEAF